MMRRGRFRAPLFLRAVLLGQRGRDDRHLVADRSRRAGRVLHPHPAPQRAVLVIVAGRIFVAGRALDSFLVTSH